MGEIHCWIRTSPYILRDILRDGRFKTRFEGYRSLASFDDLEKHAETEQEFYGYPPGLEAEQRPIFGYLCGQPNGTATHGHLILEAYGTCAIKLKDEIKKRTTFCIGDSLFDKRTPQPFSEDALPENIDEIIPYVEAQFHGGVTLADIAEVVFLVERSNASLEALVGDLVSLGIDSHIELVR